MSSRHSVCICLLALLPLEFCRLQRPGTSQPRVSSGLSASKNDNQWTGSRCSAQPLSPCSLAGPLPWDEVCSSSDDDLFTGARGGYVRPNKRKLGEPSPLAPRVMVRLRDCLSNRQLFAEHLVCSHAPSHSRSRLSGGLCALHLCRCRWEGAEPFSCSLSCSPAISPDSPSLPGSLCRGGSILPRSQQTCSICLPALRKQPLHGLFMGANLAPAVR